MCEKYIFCHFIVIKFFFLNKIKREPGGGKECVRAQQSHLEECGGCRGTKHKLIDCNCFGGFIVLHLQELRMR